MPAVRVIGDEGEQLGVMDVRDAVRAAREKGLDLVAMVDAGDEAPVQVAEGAGLGGEGAAVAGSGASSSESRTFTA